MSCPKNVSWLEHKVPANLKGNARPSQVEGQSMEDGWKQVPIKKGMKSIVQALRNLDVRTGGVDKQWTEDGHERTNGIAP